MMAMESRQGDRGASQRGIALIVALMVVAILIAVTLQFTYTTTIDLKLVRNQSREIKTYYGARAVVALAMLHLREDLTSDAGDKSTDSLGDPWAGQGGGGEPGFAGGGSFQRSVGEVGLEYRIVDEDRKICINNLIVERVTVKEAAERKEGGESKLQGGEEKKKRKAVDPEKAAKQRREKTREFIQQVLLQLDVEEAAASAMIDAMVDGAPYYSIRDLGRIEGVTPELLLGYSDDFESHPGLVDLLTVYSMGQINMNTAPREVLVAILSGKYGEDAGYFADSIIEFRSAAVDEDEEDEEEAEKEEEEEEKEEEPSEGEEEEKAGVFASLDDLPAEIVGLEEIFAGEEGDPKEAEAGLALRRQLTVKSRFFSVTVTPDGQAPRKEFRFVLKRGKVATDEMPLILWEERELPAEEEAFP